MQAQTLTQRQVGCCHAYNMAKTADLDFARRLQSLKQESEFGGMSSEKFAKKIGVSGPMVTYYLQGEKLPSMSTAIRIAQKLDCCVEYLLTGRGPKRIPEAKDPTLTLDLEALSEDQRIILRAVMDATTKPKAECG